MILPWGLAFVPCGLAFFGAGFFFGGAFLPAPGVILDARLDATLDETDGFAFLDLKTRLGATKGAFFLPLFAMPARPFGRFDQDSRFQLICGVHRKHDLAETLQADIMTVPFLR